MKEIKEIIIVEGKSDKTFISTFLKADILTCNGSATDGFDIEFLKKASKDRGVIILTDPDFPGNKIRNYYENLLPEAKHAFVRKKYSIKHHKVGVAEASKEEVLFALSNIITYDTNKVGTLTMADLMELNIVGNERNRDIIEEKLHIGKCNCKTLLKRLNMLNITIDKLKELL